MFLGVIVEGGPQGAAFNEGERNDIACQAGPPPGGPGRGARPGPPLAAGGGRGDGRPYLYLLSTRPERIPAERRGGGPLRLGCPGLGRDRLRQALPQVRGRIRPGRRSEEHTSELQSLMRISYAVFCWKTTTNRHTI